MNKKVFFNATLPRAGGTLFQNIIGQNPQFHATSTSGVSSLVTNNFKTFYDNIIFKHQKDYNLCKDSFYNYCREGINGYYSNINQNIIIDKSREWLYNVDFLQKLYKQPKVILLIRDLRAIFSSLEKQYLKDPGVKIALNSKYNLPYHSSIIDRINLYEQLPFIEYIFPVLQDLINFKNKNNIYIVKFEDLCTNPQNFMEGVYNYLQIPNFPHNFNKIDQITYENDNYQHLGDHVISSKLQLPPNNWDNYLTPSGSNYIYEKYYWYFKHFNYPK